LNFLPTKIWLWSDQTSSTMLSADRYLSTDNIVKRFVQTTNIFLCVKRCNCQNRMKFCRFFLFKSSNITLLAGAFMPLFLPKFLYNSGFENGPFFDFFLRLLKLFNYKFSLKLETMVWFGPFFCEFIFSQYLCSVWAI
jgi:hypothetical protein